MVAGKVGRREGNRQTGTTLGRMAWQVALPHRPSFSHAMKKTE